jgi:hypothetical protein
MIGDSSHRNAGNGTASDVLLKIAQCENVSRKIQGMIQKFCSKRKGNFSVAGSLGYGADDRTNFLHVTSSK